MPVIIDFATMDSMCEMDLNPSTPSFDSRPSTPERTSYASAPTVHVRRTWPLPQLIDGAEFPDPRSDAVDLNPVAAWLNISEQAERIRVNAPRVTTRMLGLDLVGDFISRLPGLRLANMMHNFDNAGGHIGCRPKVATWAFNGEKCKNCW